MRLAHIEHENVVAFIQTPFEFFNLYVARCRCHFNLLAAYAAELIVVDEFCDGRVLATGGAVGVFPQFEFAELYAERVDQKQTSSQRIA